MHGGDHAPDDQPEQHGDQAARPGSTERGEHARAQCAQQRTCGHQTERGPQAPSVVRAGGVGRRRVAGRSRRGAATGITGTGVGRGHGADGMLVTRATR
ncbi:hypothetical protein GCM10011354_10450 [Egicoccus halophilus]|uniref:Uncharacterized protein n=1 Tax=Egicoccus halophilus TaxID=1670830 RepID=A0A8J3A6P4_9ACTN|nr:hypothetical protein GCM10011354_10450 [Egicoccus halophilus]